MPELLAGIIVDKRRVVLLTSSAVRVSKAKEVAAAVVSLERAIWEHVHRAFAATGSNKSATARQLGIDRNTLKRWLERSPPAR